MSSMADITPGVVEVGRAFSNEESSDRQESDGKKKNKKSIRFVPSGEQDHKQQEENQKPASAKKKKSKSKASMDDDGKSKTKSSFSTPAVLPGVEYIDSEAIAPREEEQSSNVMRLGARAEVQSSSSVEQLATRAEERDISMSSNQKPASAKKKNSKGSRDDDAKSKTKSLCSTSAVLPGVEYIDSEVIAPREPEEEPRNSIEEALAPLPEERSIRNAKNIGPRAGEERSSNDKKSVSRRSKRATNSIVKTPAQRAEERSSRKPKRIVPRAERSSNVKKSVSRSEKSGSDDGEELSSDVMEYISKRNGMSTIDDASVSSTDTDTDTIRPGAVQVQLGRTSIKEHDPSSSEAFSDCSPMRIPSVSTDSASVTHQEEDPEAQTDDGGETLHILVATKVEESQSNLVTAVATEEDYGFDSKLDSNLKRKMLVIGACCLVLMVAVVVGVSVAFATGGTRTGTTEKEVTQETFFDTIGGGPIDGTELNGNYGVSVATNRDGSRIATADLCGVHVYELSVEDAFGSNWEMLGSTISDTICVDSQVDSQDFKALLIRTPILAAMSMDGSVVAVGWPLHNGDAGNTTSIGLVEVYLYVKESLSWERQGDSLFGNFSGDFFGSSLSLSEDGSSLAVGAAGNGGYAEVYLFNSGSWNQLGGTVVTAFEEQLGIFSVSLSIDGTILAVAGMPASKDGAVAKVFHWIRGNWEERGSGIVGQTAIEGTIYLAHLSGDGDTIVVSNYFTTEAKENTGEGLDVRAFKWSVDTNDWEPLGQKMHAGYLAEKSGYFVSLSEDGRTIAMGDPGAKSQDSEGLEGPVGHAHFLEYNDEDGEWIPLGPNYEGDAAGDQFGYAVALSGNGENLVAGAPLSRATGKVLGRMVVFTKAA